MAPAPGNREDRMPHDDFYPDERDRRQGLDERGRHGSAPRRAAERDWDARDEERMRRAQADFDYGGEGEPGAWDEQLGGYRYARRDYPEERYAARSGQRRDYGPRRYRPHGGEETTGRDYAGAISPGYAARGYEPPQQGERGLYRDPGFRDPAWSGAAGTLGPGREEYGRPDHRGRGPAGYRRSDERIREDVNDGLTEDPYLDATHIRVQVQDCEVTLDGTVDTRYAKRRAERVVEGVTGVTHVQNNLRVRDASQAALEQSQSEAANQHAAMKSEIGKKTR
ncbi:BON domain-containing protein [Desertibaculum subflavum]|uniref:BON domain-containing protein n=1 Tax=Desertibaculum subflavum TaxID=2268458 RepID=UPI0034D18EAD